MEKYTVYISCKHEGEILINGIHYGCFSPPLFMITIESDEPQLSISYLPFQPSKQKLIASQTIQLNFFNNMLISNDAFSTLTNLGAQKYLLNIIPTSLPLPINNPPYSKTFENLSIDIHNQIIHCTNSSNHIFYPIQYKLNNIEITKQNEVFFLFAETDENKKFALFLDNNLQILFEATSDKIEFNGKQIILLEDLNTIAKHGQVRICSLNETGIVNTDSYLVYLDKTPTPPANSLIIPTAFLEAISLNDITLARTYLHPKLNSTLNNSTITSFFGEFNSFFQISFSPKPRIGLIYEANPQFVKYFDFEITNNLISNIDSI